MNYLIKICVMLAVGFSIAAARAQQTQPMIGENAPSFTLKSLDDRSYSLEDMRGKFLVIHFATTWCPFCTAEAPHLEQLYRSFSSKGVQVLLIDVKENKELVKKTFERFAFTFPVLLDEDGKVATAYAPAGVLPDLARDEVVIASNLIIDPDGIIRFYSLLNSAAFDARLTGLQQKLNELLAQR